VKRGVIHTLVSRAKVICEDQKDFDREIKNIRHDLIPNEYPQEFVDTIMKPRGSNCPSDKYSMAWSLSHMLGYFQKNSDVLGTASMLGSFSKLNIHCVGH
jgi:hypothetical protein